MAAMIAPKRSQSDGETEVSFVSSQMEATATAASSTKKYAIALGATVQRSQLRIGVNPSARDRLRSVKLFFTTTPYAHGTS
ncbi:hypothetical protein GCM10022267_78570 [Lentzea roselyniae]|uniref:FXSXX-COOH protein n=1 Tax=Lentzea roselyniae TaxID=531940 RepID=A0ABP7C509_9PSEU